MKTVTLEIDGKQVTAEEGMTLLQAANQVGIAIPTLCHDERLKPAGVCRICTVEISRGDWKRMVASCVYPVEEGLKVTTDNEHIRKIRRMLVELMWPAWTRVDKDLEPAHPRFDSGHPDCNMCGLCIRYCRQVLKKDVLYWEGRGVDRHLAYVPGMGKECVTCRQCFSLCTGGWIVACHGYDEEQPAK
ncbi:MAG: (2Fe-2S)-binding protein [Deltaproteobacteria bacterium]|nr:(2Fe-2S)-binding protein [Deltaproteobacteria bacterium]